jgi:hypothetical protein
MLVRTIVVIAAGALVVAGTGCVCCPEIGGCTWPVGVSPLPALPCPCEPEDCSECSPCTACSAGETCGCPIPAWGPLSPLFAIFCWGYPDNGCGDLYFGDWPTQPRGCQPCDHWGNWVGPFGSGEISQTLGDSNLDPNLTVIPEGSGGPAEACPGCDGTISSHAKVQHKRSAGFTPRNGLVPSAGSTYFRKVSWSGSGLKSPRITPLKSGRSQTQLVPCPQCGRYHIAQPIVQGN